MWVSVVGAHGPCCLVTCEIFLDQDQIHVPSIGRQILNHWITWEATLFSLFSLYITPRIRFWTSWTDFLNILNLFSHPPHFSYCFSFLYFLRDFTNFIFQVSMFLISTIIHFIFIFKSSALFSEYYFS